MITLTILAPEETVFDGCVDRLKAPGERGEFTVLPLHAPAISTLVPGFVKYYTGQEESKIPVKGGFIEVFKDRVTICIER